MEEVHTVVHLVKHYYQHKEFCIITPYDAQRSAIQKQLENDGLPSDRVFNVDSFQGHEADYVIISAVRTNAPGFLCVQNRTNVMLTRCKMGMVIVTNRLFVQDGARSTLLGKLASYWSRGHINDIWIDWRSVAQKGVDLPGFPIRRTPKFIASPAAVPSMNRQVPTPIVSASSGQTLRLTGQEVAVASNAFSNLTVSMQRANPKAAPAQDAFPALVGGKSRAPAVQGSWKRGSSAVKKPY